MNRQKFIRGIVLGWLLLFLIIPSYHVTAVSDEYWPDHNWRTSTPESQGIDSGTLVNMLEFIQSNPLGIHSVIVIRHGYVVLEAYAEPFRKNVTQVIYSCTKSFTSALVGIAIDKGYIKNINQKVVDIFSDRNIKNLDDKKRSITIKYLLTMSSGIDLGDYGNSDKRYNYARSSDWTQFYLDIPVTAQPGKKFSYDSQGVNLLMSIVQKTSGMKTAEFAENFLFKPIGITNYYWRKDPQGINTGGYGLALTPMEMARFGYLYLKNGNWNGKQVVPAIWVKTSLVSHIESNGPLAISTDKGYGYLWWGLPFNGFTALGAYGQYIMVMPQRDMVVVFTSESGNSNEPLQLTEDFILKSIISDHSILQNHVKQAKLAVAIRELRNPSSPVKQVIPKTAQKISGKKYVLDANPWNMKSIMLRFNGTNECIYEEESPGFLFFNKHFKMVAGLDGKYRKIDLPRIYDICHEVNGPRKILLFLSFIDPGIAVINLCIHSNLTMISLL